MRQPKTEQGGDNVRPNGSSTSGPGDQNDRGITIPDRSVVEAHLMGVRPECDRSASPDDDVEVRIGRGLKHSKEKGYAKFLVTLGYDPNWAGMLAAMIVEEGRIRAATSQKSTEFARALRRLASGLFDELRPFEGLCS